MKAIIALFIVTFCCISLQAQTKERAQLPPKINEFVNTHFVKNAIIKWKIDDGEYEVKLNNGNEISFDMQGEWVEIESNHTPLPKSIIDLLPSPIMVYIAQKYPRKAVIKIERIHVGYEVELLNSAELVFDKQGKFLYKD